jgi:concanavalin A-like lectin/glucanase superfamily protein
MAFGKVQPLSQEKKLFNISGENTSTNQQAVAVPHCSGVFKIALTWVGPAYNLRSRKESTGGGGKGGKGGSGQGITKWSGDIIGVACVCMDDAPVDSLLYVLVNDDVALTGPLNRTGGTHYAAITLEQYCQSGRIYWGTKDQPIDTLVATPRESTLPTFPGFNSRIPSTWRPLPPNGNIFFDPSGDLISGVPDPRSGHYDSIHPAYRNQCYFVFKNFELGGSPNMPNVEVILKRGNKFFSGSISSAAQGINPMGHIFEAFADNLFGCSIPVAQLNETSWQTAKTDCDTNGIKLAPRVTQAGGLRSFVADYVKYFNGFFRRIGNAIEAGVFKMGNFDQSGLLTLGDDDLAGEPNIRPGSLDNTKNLFFPVISNRAHWYNPDDTAARFVSQENFDKVGKRRPEWVPAPFIIDGGVGQIFINGYGMINSEEGASGSAPFKREKVNSLQPGDLFKINAVSYALTMLLQVTQKKRPADGSGVTNLSVVRAAGTWPALYFGPGAETPPDFLNEIAAIAYARVVELPRGLRSNVNVIQVAVLALRSSPHEIGFRTHLSLDDVDYEQIAEDNHFAVLGRLTYDLSTLAGVVFLHEARTIVGVDGDVVSTWEDLGSLSNDATQSTAGNKPILKKDIVNRQSVVRFDGVNDFLSSPAAADTKPCSFFAVVGAASLAADGVVVGSLIFGGAHMLVQASTGTLFFQKSGIANIGSSSSGIAASTFVLVEVTYDGSGNFAFFINGTAAGVGTNNQTFVSTTTIIGSSRGTSAFFNGDIAALLKLDHVATATERHTIEAYFGSQYGLTVANDGVGYPDTTDDVDETVGAIIDLFGFDLERIKPQSDQARDDDTLLCWMNDEINSVGDQVALGSGRFRIFMRRAQFNTLKASHNIGALCWFAVRSDLLPIDNANFIPEAEVFFKLAPFSQSENFDVATADAIDFTFGQQAIVPAAAIDPPACTFTGTLIVSVSIPAGNFTVHFAENGSRAGAASPEWPKSGGSYTTKSITASTRLSVVVVDDHGRESDEVVVTYILTGTQTSGPVTFLFSGTTHKTGGTLTAQCATPASVIKYKKNGGSTTTYSGPLTGLVSNSTGDKIEIWSETAGMNPSAHTFFDNTYIPSQGGGGGGGGFRLPPY